MARYPAITFRGALELLGHYDRPWLERLNAVCGVAILGAGVAPSATAVSTVWGWIDQKNEAAGLLRRALDAVSDRIVRTDGLERHELVIAAHTTILLAAFFDAVGASRYGHACAEVAIVDREKLLLTGSTEEQAGTTAQALYSVPVPAPSGAYGFEENLDRVATWAHGLCDKLSVFMVKILGRDEFESHFGGSHSDHVGLAAVHEAVTRGTVSLYRSSYLRLSARVPEFAVWANQIEHVASRKAMERLEGLLSWTNHAVVRDLRAFVRDANEAELRKPVLDAATDGYGSSTAYPAVEDLFVDPCCRVGTVDHNSRVGDEQWWRDKPIICDLALLLARHFCGSDATTLPLLMLGHPGAGKSLVTKVIAARLPPEKYTVVRVALRHVDAAASVPVQVQQALDQITHSRVPWHDLVEQSAQAIRVVLLDGLDELLQASTTDRGDYLHRIVEFQRTEAALGRPVAVVVTSRTLVAERVSMPRHMTVVKLEEFDGPQITTWVDKWNAFRAVAGVPALQVSTMLKDQRHLAAQPLLLLMLALYYEGMIDTAEQELSQTQLYERLFADYAGREVTKRSGRNLPKREHDSAVLMQLRTLAVAALGMFNRGRQDITEAELGEDLKVLEKHCPSGQQLLGEFFFIHAPEVNERALRRSYEFLHATFGEYLVASRVVEELLEVAEGAFGRRRNHDPDDDLLFALLSHQPLAVQRPVLDFVQHKMSALPRREQRWISDALDVLIARYRDRRVPRLYAEYRPTPSDTLRALAAYSANLVLLRVRHSLAHRGVNISALFGESDPLAAWRAMVDLWRAGLEEPAYYALIGELDLVDGNIVTTAALSGWGMSVRELHHARLRHDLESLSRLRHGYALRSASYVVMRGTRQSRIEEWCDYASAWLHAAIVLPAHQIPILAPIHAPQGIDEKRRLILKELAATFLLTRARSVDIDFLKKVARWWTKQLEPSGAQLLSVLHHAQFAASSRHSALLREIEAPQVQDESPRGGFPHAGDALYFCVITDENSAQLIRGMSPPASPARHQFSLFDDDKCEGDSVGY